MERAVSKSDFKAKALQFFREVEQSKRPLVITDRGRPVLELRPFEAESEATLQSLRGSVRRYDDPTEPVGTEDWEALR